LTAALCLAAFAGLMLALIATEFGERTVYFLATGAVGGVGALVAFTRREPLRFVFLALLCGLPLASALVPPGRLGVTVFDVVMVLLTLGLVGKTLLSPAKAREPLFPTTSLSIAWVLCVPIVVLSQFPLPSLLALLLTFSGVHVFFLLTLRELERHQGFERLTVLLSAVVIVMALGVLIDHALQVNLSLRGSNMNQLTYLAGIEIYRAGGFFQDPQKSGAFLACLITFLLVLAVRRRFDDTRTRSLLWFAILIGSLALPMTIARGAILAFLAVSTMTLFAFNTWSFWVKATVTGAAVVTLMVMAQISIDLWLDVVPAPIMERFVTMQEGLEDRLKIWSDTWDMFADHPITGIGPGSFQRYLLETRPGVFNYYGIGTNLGVPYVPDQPESGYLKIFYEGGLIGTAAALLIACDGVRRALAVVTGAGMEPNARTECIAALAALATFATTFVTLFHLTDPRMGALLAFFLAVIWRRSLQRLPGAPKA
jgi:O-antigen ligase